MNTKIQFAIICVFLGTFAGIGFADTFINEQTGETFNGFMTQRSTGSKTLVYNSDAQELTAINLSEYEVTPNAKGRKKIVVVVPITESEALLSQVVAETIAETIIDSSNKGPLAIIIQIDSPGGRGDYMKIITSAITQTNNCPVVAYISGREYGGAFSAAALIAMACDEVFIAPTASIGAIGPYGGAAVSDEDFVNYVTTYCSDALASYSIYATALAHEHNRPPLLVRALVDKHISVEEVAERDGTRSFVQEDERQSTQTRVRTLAEGIDSTASLQEIPQGQVISAVLNLPPTVAVDVGLADGIVASLPGVLTAMDIDEAQLTNASGIEKTIQKFAAARRNIAESLARIQWLEDRTALLEEQLTEIQQQLRTGTVTREVTRRPRSTFGRDYVGLPDDYYRYYYDPGMTGRRPYLVPDSYTSGVGGPRPDRTTETIITQEPKANLGQVQRELVIVLNDLISAYRRAMSQAKRWPGGLPPEISYQTLQQNSDSAAALRDYLFSPSFLGQPGVQQQVPVVPPVRRNRY